MTDYEISAILQKARLVTLGEPMYANDEEYEKYKKIIFAAIDYAKQDNRNMEKIVHVDTRVIKVLLGTIDQLVQSNRNV